MNDKEAERFRNDEEEAPRQASKKRTYDGSASGTFHFPGMSETSTGVIELPQIIREHV